jgi:hypothetical protein
MAESAVFEAACSCLEQEGSLDRLAARGTIRLTLKQAGLEPKTVTARQLDVVLKKLLPAELTSRGIPAPDELCARISKALEGIDSGARSDSPEAIFARLAGS